MKSSPLEFVMGFVANSKRYRSQYIDKWQEVLANYMVQPYDSATVDDPYRSHSRWNRTTQVVLKDGETHKVIQTYAAKLVLSALGDTRSEYVVAETVGYEDAAKARTVTKLLRYNFSNDGIFRTLNEAVVDMLLFGTAVVEIPWRYVEREMLVRSMEDVYGVEVDSFQRMRVAAYNDVDLQVVDIQDFYPDPGAHTIERMSGVAKRFRMTEMQARTKIGGEYGYEEAAVTSAYGGGAVPSSAGSDYDDEFREDRDQPRDRKTHPDFKPGLGIEYWGNVPWEDAAVRRVVTIINGVVVRDCAYPLADEDLPFRSLTINPVCGRFWGISPAEVIRYDQDLQDAVKILLAEAILRQVHPPIAYDPDSEIDLAKLRAWSPDAPIAVRGGPSSIGTVKYDAGVYAGFQLAAVQKQDMEETSGATAALKGQSLGTKRMSATEADTIVRQGMDRPELAAALLERDSLPKIGKSFLRRNQQFLQDADELRQRVGELPESVWLGDILGDFDIRFVGSRMAMSRSQKLQAVDRIISYAAVLPSAAALLPHASFLQMIVGEVLELPEIALLIGDPKMVQLNMLMSQMSGGAQAGNNGVPTKVAPDLAAAQLAGGVQ